jgi:aminoglycoside phosphotransferase (APT) family kinase protein
MYSSSGSSLILIVSLRAGFLLHNLHLVTEADQPNLKDPTYLAPLIAGFIEGQLGRRVEISDLVRLPGGASRETWSFLLTENSSTRRIIMRRDPNGGPASTQRSTEFELLGRAAAAGVPVPDVMWLCTDPKVLGAPVFFMEHIEGETIPRKILREDAFREAREVMASQCGEILARIHAIDIDGVPGLVAAEGKPALQALSQYRTVFDSFGEPHPAFELGLRWLEQRAPEHERVTLVHGDFRHGNFIVGRDGIRAVIDWELAHIGDPWEDLAWLCVRAWRFGGSAEVGGFGSRADLYSAYERVSGESVDASAVHWWEVFGTLKWGVITMVQAFTHLMGRVRSVELAAIGRRTVETEYDLLNLIGRDANPTPSDK